MAELGSVSARPARLAGLVEKGVTGSRRALALASDPGKFLSTVQIGITLIGVLSGAFSGATLGLRLTAWLVELGLPQGLADAIGVGAVVTVITYASLIVGELVPKQIALRDPEAVAVRVAPYMVLLSKISPPLVWLLDRSGKVLLWLLGQRGEAEEKVSEDEIRTLVVEAESVLGIGRTLLARGGRNVSQIAHPVICQPPIAVMASAAAISSDRTAP